jgi:hypothetical protein
MWTMIGWLKWVFLHNRKGKVFRSDKAGADTMFGDPQSWNMKIHFC